MSLPFENGDRFFGLGEHVVFQGSEMDHEWVSTAPTPGAAEVGVKKVIDITPNQARELIANVSEKSQDALRLFASGEPVLLEVLVGPNAPYRDLNDLKRSLVGAVNRRLRTVTEDRSAVLFSSDRDKTRIRVTPLTAAALRQALNIQEPIPNFEYFDPSGFAQNGSTEQTFELKNRLKSAWAKLILRPHAGQWELSIAQVYGHFLENGFVLAAGRPQHDGPGEHSLQYQYEIVSGDVRNLISQMDYNGNVRDAGVEGRSSLRLFLQSPDFPSIFCAASS
jgi:hypothetical protein